MVVFWAGTCLTAVVASLAVAVGVYVEPISASQTDWWGSVGMFDISLAEDTVSIGTHISLRHAAWSGEPVITDTSPVILSITECVLHTADALKLRWSEALITDRAALTDVAHAVDTAIVGVTGARPVNLLGGVPGAVNTVSWKWARALDTAAVAHAHVV